MLIDEDRVSIRVHGDEAGRPRCALVRLLLQLHPCAFNWRCRSRTSVKEAQLMRRLARRSAASEMPPYFFLPPAHCSASLWK